MRSIRKRKTILTTLFTSIVIISVMASEAFAEEYRLIAFDTVIEADDGGKTYLSEGTKVNLDGIINDDLASVSNEFYTGPIMRNCLRYQTRYIHKSNLNLRNAPVSGDVIITMPVGSKVSVISSENGWSKVSYNGQIGYCSNDYLIDEQVIGSYSTQLMGDSGNTNNINMACFYLNGGELKKDGQTQNKIPGNGMIVRAGQEFSYLTTIKGESTKENGFEESVVLVNGKRERGIGGGVCQVSSTLYATIMSNEKCKEIINITERHAHSKGVAYVPKGLDATVWYNSLDFRFVPKADIKIYSYVENGMCTVEIVKI